MAKSKDIKAGRSENLPVKIKAKMDDKRRSNTQSSRMLGLIIAVSAVIVLSIAYLFQSRLIGLVDTVSNCSIVMMQCQS